MRKINRWRSILIGIALLATVFVSISRTSSASAASTYNYAEALQKAIYFYDAQRSGTLPANNRVEWRGNSGLTDGADVGKDLTGGWYDAGDHVKFGFPMAASSTLLSWSVVEYRSAYVQSGQLNSMLANIKWSTDYFIKAFTNDQAGSYEFYGQVGAGNTDHAWWGPAEVMQMARPSYKITTACPGSDLAGETAAALASASIAFRQNGDTTYADLLLLKAERMYNFADQYRGKYSDCITDAASFYNSWSGYNDELVWGALWLHRAELAKNAAYGGSYLTKAQTYYANLGNQTGDTVHSYKWTHAWDDKSYGSYVLMAELSNSTAAMTDAQRWLDWWTVGVNGSRITYTLGGLAWLDQWGSLRYSMNTAFIALVYSDYLASHGGSATLVSRYHDFALNQVNYALGNNPSNRSYEIGFGANSPRNPHHRTSHGSWTDNINDPVNQRHVLYGALVGGPNSTDAYTDSRSDYVSNEVATDYNAGFTGALARLYKEYGGTTLAGFPAAETRENEIFVEAGVNSASANYLEVVAWINNKSAWPARMADQLKMRYFFTLDAASASDVTVTANYNQCGAVTGPTLYSGNIYYVEVNCVGTKIYPGGQSAYRKEVQFRMASTSGNWNNANDWSYTGIGASRSTPLLADRLVLYSNGTRIWGTEPNGTPNPTTPAPTTPAPTTPAPTTPAPTTPAPTTPAPTTPAPTTPAPTTPAPGSLKVQYKAADTIAADNQIKPHIQLVNTGSTAVPMSELTVRYWFTREGTTGLTFSCDYAVKGCGNVTGGFTSITPVTGANYYLQLSFGTGAGSIAANGNSGEIQARINKTDWSNFNEADDYSFDPTKTAFADWNRVTLYRNGVLVWGVEPSGGTPVPTTPAPTTPAPTTPAPTTPAPTTPAPTTPAPTTPAPTTPAPTTPAPTTPAPTTPAPTTPAPGSLKVQYKAADTVAADNQIKPHLNIINTGSASVPMSELTVRYWFTREGTTGMTFSCDYAVKGCGNVTGAFTSITPVTGANYYLQLSFGTGAGSIPAGGSSGEIQARINKTDWSNFNEADDYSFDPTKTAFTDWNRVTVYRNGVLVWGVEPSGGTPVPTTPAPTTPAPTTPAPTTPPPGDNPPSVPGNLTSPSKTANSITLTWTASTDDKGVTGYRVYRGVTLVGSPTGLTFTDTGLLANTAYQYVVRAVDTVGQQSATTPVLTVTTSPAGTAVVFRVNTQGRITKNGVVFPIHGGSWFGLQGRYEPASDSVNPRGAPMEQYIGNTFWANGGAGTGRTIAQTMSEIKALGINVIRLPLVHQTLDPNDPQGRDPVLKNHPSVRVANSRLALEQFIIEADKADIQILLDIHSCSNYVDWRKGRLDARPPYVDATRDNYDFTREDSSCSATNNPATVTRIQAYNETIWLQDLKTLAGLDQQLGVDNIIGIDIYNEPWDYTWAEWKTLGEHAYTAINSVNPNILIFMQGISSSAGNQDGTPTTVTQVPYGSTTVTVPNWGENLFEAGANPPAIPKDRLVFSPHAYGPSVFVSRAFMDPAQPQCAGLEGDAAGDAKCNIVINPTLLKQGWEEHFGYLKQLGYAVVVGEFGGNMDWPLGQASMRDRNRFAYLTDKTVDNKWQQAFVDYLSSKGIEGIYWSINPESGDTAGIYGHAYDPVSNPGGWGEWKPFDTRKVDLLKRLWNAIP